MKDANRKVLEDILSAMPKLLLARIKDGSATASDLSVARQLLRDNQIQAKPVAESPLANLAESIPTFDDQPSYE